MPTERLARMPWHVADAIAHFEAKLQRAEELIAIVRDGINEFFAGDPIATRTEHHRHDYRIELWVDSVRQPPLRLSVLMGEFVHNVRSTLDQLVWSLARTQVAHPHRRHQFPICVTPPTSWERPTTWDKIAADRLRSVPADAVERIWQAQPCNGQHPESNVLTILQTLSNEDKHRVLLRPLSIPKQPGEEHFQVVTRNVLEEVRIEASAGAPLEAGTRLVAVEYVPRGPSPEARSSPRASGGALR